METHVEKEMEVNRCKKCGVDEKSNGLLPKWRK